MLWNLCMMSMKQRSKWCGGEIESNININNQQKEKHIKHLTPQERITILLQHIRIQQYQDHDQHQQSHITSHINNVNNSTEHLSKAFYWIAFKAWAGTSAEEQGHDHTIHNTYM
jgi:hypothetical protein